MTFFLQRDKVTVLRNTLTPACNNQSISRIRATTDRRSLISTLVYIIMQPIAIIVCLIMHANNLRHSHAGLCQQ